MNSYLHIVIFGIVCLTCIIDRCHGDKPHILLITADDVGWNDVGFLGSEVRTPHLDELAAAGVILDNYYSQPSCSPSRTQLLTGRLQIHLGNSHGIFHGNRPSGLSLTATTLGEKLQAAGYRSHLVGKWHVGFFTPQYLPTRRGFHSFYGMHGGTADHYSHTIGARFGGEEQYLDLWDDEQPVFGETEYSTNLFSRKAVEVVQNHDPSQPLFLMLSYQAPHRPLQVPWEYERAYRDIADTARRQFAGMMTCMDDGIRNVTDALKASGMWHDTLVIFSSDNGGDEMQGASNYPLRGQKSCLYEGGIRVPAFISGDRLAANAGTTSQELIHISDWFPTLVSLAGGSVGQDVDSFDMWDTLSNGSPGPRQEILHELDILYRKIGNNTYPDIFDVRVRAALRQRNWKLVTGRADSTGFGFNWDGQVPQPRKPEGEAEDKNLWLFDLNADPNETSDVSMEHPDVVERLLRRLADYFATSVPPVYPCPDPRSNPQLNNNALGPYLTPEEAAEVEPLCADEGLVEEFEEFGHKQTGDAAGSHSCNFNALLVVFGAAMCFLTRH